MLNHRRAGLFFGFAGNFLSLPNIILDWFDQIVVIWLSETGSFATYRNEEVLNRMWVQGWLVVFSLIILLLYGYYFLQILLGRPERFEVLLSEGLQLETEDVQPKSRFFMVAVVIGLSLMIEGGYFILAWVGINIPYYRVLTGLFIAFEVWHGTQLVPVVKDLLEGAETLAEKMNWKIERLAAQFYVIHIVITLALLFTI